LDDSIEDVKLEGDELANEDFLDDYEEDYSDMEEKDD